MSEDNERNEAEARDIEDLERVLAAIFASSHEDLVDKSLKTGRTSLSKRVPRTAIKIEGLPGLRFKAGDPVILGGGGIVIGCANAEIPALRYALKVPRPSLFAKETKDTAAEYQRAQAEYLKHAPLSHKNVARVFGGGKLSLLAREIFKLDLTAIIMEWVEGAQPLEKYLRSAPVDHLQLVDLVTQCFDGLDHIHTRRLIHWDIKSDNLLVDSFGTVKIADLGNSRRTDDPDRDRIALSTRQNLPPSLKCLVPEGPDDPQYSLRRTPIELPDLSWDDPWLDMWMLARELSGYLSPRDDGEELLGACFPRDDDNAQLTLASLQLVLERLLHPADPAAERYYRQAGAVVHDLKKLTPEFGAAQSVPELQAIPQRVMRLPTTGNAPYSPRVGRVFNCHLIQRLSRHYQLGTLAQVYPGATHRRSEHVAGVMATTAQYVRALFADRTDPFWRLAIEARDIDALLLAALLHDVGHIAFGHFLEEMSGLLRHRMHEDYVLAMVDPARRQDLAHSAAFGNRIEQDRRILSAVLAADWVAPGDDAASLMTYVGEILRPGSGTRAIFRSDARLLPGASQELKVQVLHSIIDGAIDADKVDYLLRDGYHCGVKYGDGIDQERFFQSLTTVTHLNQASASAWVEDNAKEPRRTATVAVTPKGIIPVESILVSRYQMFNSVYWHHTARAETSMLQFLVQEYVSDGRAVRVEARVEPDMNERLERLIDRFRDLSDRQALEWLRDNLPGSGRRKTMLKAICDGLLGERQNLYWSAFELRYERPREGPREGGAKSVYDRLMAVSDELNRSPTLADYVSKAWSLRSNFSAWMETWLGEQGRSVRFEDGEVLIDIPPVGADQIENIFVNDGERIKTIQDLSPIADAVRDTFGLWARKVRVFMAPGAWKRCAGAGAGSEMVAESCWWAMSRMAAQLEPQMLLLLAVKVESLPG